MKKQENNSKHLRLAEQLRLLSAPQRETHLHPEVSNLIAMVYH